MEVETVLDKCRIALELRRDISEAVGINPQIRIHANDNITLETSGINPEGVRAFVKILHIQLNKTVTAGRFLKYEGNVQGIKIYISTKECFYGGTPIVQHNPRSFVRFCPRVVKK